MPVLERSIWELFAQCVAKGMSESEAYAEAYDKESLTPAVNTGGWRLMRKSEIRARIDELKAEAASECTFEIAERLDILTGIARKDEAKDSDRINAIREFTRIKGDGAADRVEHTVSSDLAQAIAFLRSGERPAIEAQAEVMQLPDAQADTQ